MPSPGGISASSLSALMKDYETITHNLANINTIGYKRKINSFSRELMRQMARMDKKTPATGGELKANESLDFSQGATIHSKRNLDVAIAGSGFFVVETPNGPLYTRCGSFQLNVNNGHITDLSGRSIGGENGPIIVPRNYTEHDISISEDGVVSAGGTNLGRLKLVEFGEDIDKLRPAGENCLAAPSQLRPVQSNSQIWQGFRENSNVNLMEEMANMITVTRLYEMNMSVIKRNRENNRAMVDLAKSV